MNVHTTANLHAEVKKNSVLDGNQNPILSCPAQTTLPNSLSSPAQCSTITRGLGSPTSSLDAAEKQNIFPPAKNQITVILSLY